MLVTFVWSIFSPHLLNEDFAGISDYAASKAAVTSFMSSSIYEISVAGMNFVIMYFSCSFLYFLSKRF